MVPLPWSFPTNETYSFLLCGPFPFVGRRLPERENRAHRSETDPYYRGRKREGRARARRFLRRYRQEIRHDRNPETRRHPMKTRIFALFAVFVSLTLATFAEGI